MKHMKLFEAFLNEERIADWSKVKKLPSYKALIKMGYTDSSTAKQDQNGTIVLDAPGERYADGSSKELAYLLYSNGYVRRRPKPNSIGVVVVGIVDTLPAPKTLDDWESMFQRVLKAIATSGKRTARANKTAAFDWKDFLSEAEWKVLCDAATAAIDKAGIPKKEYALDKKFFASYEGALESLNKFYDFGTGRQSSVRQPGYTFPLVTVHEKWQKSMEEIPRKKTDYLEMFGGYLALGNRGIGLYPIKSKIQRKLSESLLEGFNVNADDRSSTIAGSIEFVKKRIAALKKLVADKADAGFGVTTYAERLKADEAYLEKLKNRSK